MNMQGFIEIYGFLAVLLRGVALAAQSGTIGGVVFLALLDRVGAAPERLRGAVLRLIFWCAVSLAAAQGLAAAALGAMLSGTLGLPPVDALSADAALVELATAAVAAAIALAARRSPASQPGGRLWMGPAALALVATQALATHAASRADGGPALVLAEMLHMSAVGLWIGGIPYFLIGLWLTQAEERAAIARGFSFLSVAAVATLIGSGAFMGLHYVRPFEALYGTSYGVMLGAKLALLGALLLLGGMNYLSTERLSRAPGGPVNRLRRFAEAEIGIGLTALFCAASLTSLPPAADLPAAERASFFEVVDRLAPRWPVRLESPDHAELSVAQPAALQNGLPSAAPRSAEDVAWSEYNHHWAGIFVLAMGLLALLERAPAARPVARHWPLVFLGLAGFLFLRADEAVWPLGELGLIESLRDPEIAQHRLMILLIVAFGVFEWRVRLGRVAWRPAALVFPLTTATAAAFLLTHSHGLANPKEELLIEITHTPLALVGVAAGWSRWLELRLDGRASRIAGLVWPIALALAGAMLLFYREA